MPGSWDADKVEAFLAIDDIMTIPDGVMPQNMDEAKKNPSAATGSKAEYGSIRWWQKRAQGMRWW
jgi:hypothetical protein